MAATRRHIVVRAPAKINLLLQLGARQPDGYHDLHTIFQSLALHDTLTFVRRVGPLTIECEAPAVPTDRTNLIWRAARSLWQKMGRHGDPRDVVVRVVKRIPVQAGLGGGSSDGVAALRALATLWRVKLEARDLAALAASLGADAPYFVMGGTALGLGRGDELYPLTDLPQCWVVLAVPSFGISTRDAYEWVDQDRGLGSRDASRANLSRSRQPEAGSLPTAWPTGPLRVVNDFEGPVSRRHAEIGELTAALGRAGATAAALAGSGSAVFGIFADTRRAQRAALDLGRLGYRVLLSRTCNRAAYQRSVKPNARSA